MGVGDEMNLTGEENAKPSEERSDDFYHRTQELQEQSERNMGEISHEMIKSTRKYSHLLNGRIGYVAERHVVKEEADGDREKIEREVRKGKG